MKHEEEELNRI